MIRKREIEQIAEIYNIPKSTVDKDWVLGHFLDAIYSLPECREHLIFKGGTCLRKCYFQDYRFSEDLDFTATNTAFKFDINLLSKITDLITTRTSISLHIHELVELRSKDELKGYKAIVKFWGADHSFNQAPPPIDRWNTSVKIEIILFEKLIFPVEQRPIFHPYSDGLTQESSLIPCYSLSEVLAEKLRALIQRSYTAPRDIFDIWYLSNNVQSIDWSAIHLAFHEKMKFKNLHFNGIQQMFNEVTDQRVKQAWKTSLGHQIPGGLTYPYDQVKAELLDLLKKIFI
jgi:predicted nucleotidyltransferase component of viral defense system